jgi:hypothetical protein
MEPETCAGLESRTRVNAARSEKTAGHNAVKCPVCRVTFAVDDTDQELVYCGNIECPVYRFDGLDQEVAQ